jgi:pilus assembly protein CpaD
MRTLKLLPMAALAVSLTACGAGTTNRGVDSVHQPVISRTDYVFDLNDGMGAQSSQRLAGWFQSLNLGFGDRVSLDDPSGNPSNRAAVASAANRFGVAVQDTAPITQGELVPGMFRVVVSRSKAEVPGCPDWSRSSQGNYAGDAPSNYGCATNSNLAAMVANPNDLVAGTYQNDPTNSNARGAAAIRKMTTPASK